MVEFFPEQLRDYHVEARVLGMVPASVMAERFLMPIAFDEATRTLSLVTSRPMDAFRDMAIVTRLIHRHTPAVDNIKLFEVDYANFPQGYMAHFRQQFSPTTAVQSTASSGDNVSVTSEQTKLAQDILQRGIESGASDIHIAPYKDGSRVQFRIDGVLRDSGIPPLSIDDERMLCNIYKRNSGLEVTNLVPQDGRFTAFGKDFRLSTMPYGDSGARNKVVMRIIGSSEKVPTLEALNFTDDEIAAIRRMIHQPSGIILVCGPTGEGKSTTLYACLKEIAADNDKVIVTIEDPIEKYIDGISQSQIHPAELERNALTFPKAIRSFLRQDPDVIMVGEIRDSDTALVAVQSSQTGHLILSTLHVRNSFSVFRRLSDMGANVSGFTEQIVGITSQRLLSVLCPHCRRAVVSPYNDLIREKDRALFEKGITYEAVGCERCKHTGIVKRVPIMEIIEFDNYQRDYFAGKHGLIEIETYLRKEKGFRSLWDKGMEFVKRGSVSLKELVETIPVDVDLGIDEKKEQP